MSRNRFTDASQYWLNFCFSDCKLFYVSFRARTMPSVLWRCWLSDRKGIRWDAGMVICLQRGVGVHMTQLMPLPLTVSCFSKSRLVLHFWYRLTWVVIFRFITIRLSLQCSSIRHMTCAVWPNVVHFHGKSLWARLFGKQAPESDFSCLHNVVHFRKPHCLR